MKVKILTCNSFEKIHPRISMQVDILASEGFDVEVIKSPTKKDLRFQDVLNLFSLKYFRRGAIKQFSKQINENDIVHIYDFQLLPLAKIAKQKNCKVIYETLDDNVHLHFHSLQKLIPGLKFFRSLIIGKYAKKERKISDQYCDAIIVNSANLLEKFNTVKTHLIYYASNLTLKNHLFDCNKEVRFLYMGKLTIEKGAKEYAQLIQKHKIPLIFYGHFGDKLSEEILGNNELVIKKGNMGIEDLNIHLLKDIEQYNLIGLSVIHPINKSYKMQEANKDIDYITVGIPFIGNNRPPTFAKIKIGCGILNTDENKIKDLIGNRNNQYNNIVNQDHLTVSEYSKETFSSKLMSVYENLNA